MLTSIENILVNSQIHLQVDVLFIFQHKKLTFCILLYDSPRPQGHVIYSREKSSVETQEHRYRCCEYSVPDKEVIHNKYLSWTFPHFKNAKRQFHAKMQRNHKLFLSTSSILLPKKYSCPCVYVGGTTYKLINLYNFKSVLSKKSPVA